MNNNELAVFQHENFTTRTITDDNGEIWFVAKDVAQALGYGMDGGMSKYFANVPEIWKGGKRISSRSENGVEQQREMLCLTEQGLYFFLGRSDKKAALPYQMWIAGEVVPSIRKHGAYLTPQKAEEIIANPDLIIKLAETVKEERAKNQALTAKIEEDRPKVIFAEAVDASDGSILIGELAKILRQNGINVGEIRLFKWMRDKGYLCRARGEDWNLPTQRAMDSGLFKIKKTAVNDPNKGAIIRRTPKVTGKGQIYFINGFKDGRFVI